MLVDAKLCIVMFDARDSCELARDIRALRANGERLTLASGTKSPWLAGHVKYLRRNSVSLFCLQVNPSHSHLFPPTIPSFLPEASSSSIPHQVPCAKCPSPMYRRCPRRLPVCDLTMTRSLTSKAVEDPKRNFLLVKQFNIKSKSQSTGSIRCLGRAGNAVCR